MYKETNNGSGNLALLLAGILALGFFSNAVVSHITSLNLIQELVMIVVFGILTYLLIRYRLMCYEYSVIDTTIVFDRILGKNQYPLLEIEADDIVEIYPISHKKQKSDKNVFGKYNFCATLQRKNRYVLEFSSNDKIYNVIFQPTENFLSAVKKAKSKKQIAKDEDAV